MAAMSVIGIDLGSDSCYVSVAKAGGIETIANDYSLRATPSYVAFCEQNRIMGVAAKNQQVTNMKNTVYGLKRLIGRKFQDPQVQRELLVLPFDITETFQGNIGIKVNYLNQEHIFSPEQCLAMLLTKLKDIAGSDLKTPINDCVISVPSYFTNNERRALLDSAAIAGLNVLRLFNETTATALSYGLYKQDLPTPEDDPRNVVFVDCGHSSLQVSICAFNKGKLRMIATASDPNLGGRDVDLILVEHFRQEFAIKYNMDVRSNHRASLRLLAEVEKLKKQMSANSTSLPLNIECFMNDQDVHAVIKRADMEQLCKPLFQRVEDTLKQCLDQSRLVLDDIHSVEIVGGSSRIPAIKQLIETIFNKVPSTTLNQDEAVSRGCALQCAILSPAVKVREFNVKDVQNYPVFVSWDSDNDGEVAGEMEAFPVNHAFPYSKMLTFNKQQPFSLRLFYSGNVPYPDKHIGNWSVKDVNPNPEGLPQKVKVKVRINLHGIVTISSATLIEAKESCEAENSEESHKTNDQQQGESNVDNNMADDGSNIPENDDKDKKKKRETKSIDLPIESIVAGFSQKEIDQFIEQELKMIASDKQEKERVDVRNTLEEYVYELRNKLTFDGELVQYLLESNRSVLVNELNEMENWLYEEGNECHRQVYQDKLTELKSKGDPINARKSEYDQIPGAMDEYLGVLQLNLRTLEEIRKDNPKYAHFTDEDTAKLSETFQQWFDYLEDARIQCQRAPKHFAPPITAAQIRQKKGEFEKVLEPFLREPPPIKLPQEDEKKGTTEKTEEKKQPEEAQSEEMEWNPTN